MVSLFFFGQFFVWLVEVLLVADGEAETLGEIVTEELAVDDRASGVEADIEMISHQALSASDFQEDL